MTSLEKLKKCGGYCKQELLQGRQQTGLITARLQEVVSSRFSQFEPRAGVSEGITSHLTSEVLICFLYKQEPEAVSQGGRQTGLRWFY